jgi:hypothetical protein
LLLLTLLLKGIFLLRKSSEGLGLSEQELANLSGPTNRKRLPSIATQAAQIVQDFGTGAFLLWPLLNMGKDIDNSWSDPPRLRVFLAGAVLFSLGWRDLLGVRSGSFAEIGNNAPQRWHLTLLGTK